MNSTLGTLYGENQPSPSLIFYSNLNQKIEHTMTELCLAIRHRDMDHEKRSVNLSSCLWA